MQCVQTEGKYSTSSELKTWCMKSHKCPFNTEHLETTIVTVTSLCLFFLRRLTLTTGDAGKWEKYYPEREQLLDSLSGYCVSIFYDKSHSLIIISTPRTNHWVRVYMRLVLSQNQPRPHQLIAGINGEAHMWTLLLGNWHYYCVGELQWNYRPR